jgi:glycosyltransferase involved in cell wall biosynthesis
MLHRAMADLAQRQTLSFVRQYPVWLFPGESERDPGLLKHREPGVDYVVDSLNPFTWATTVRKCREHKPEMLVIPWWTVYWAPFSGYLARKLRSQTNVVFLCHNVVDHEGAWWKTMAARKALGTARCFLVHSQAQKKILLGEFPDAEIKVYPHPIYEQFPACTGPLPRRAGLELLFFGFVRPYKGLDVLIEAMGDLKGRDIHLTAVGEFWKGYREICDRIEHMGLAGQIEIVPRFVTDQEAAGYFDRADAVVLPYRSATGSGVIPLAYHYNKPVISSRLGGLTEVIEEGVSGFTTEPGNPGALAAVLKANSGEDFRAMTNGVKSYKRNMTWDGLAMKLLEFIS